MKLLPFFCIGLCTLFLAACDPAPKPPVARAIQEAPAPVSASLFELRERPRGVARSNKDIAREFLELSFELENGSVFDRFTRFTGPITVAYFAPPTSAASHDLDMLIARLRKEALIDIRRGPTGRSANILIQTISAKEMAQIAPGAACFVVPNAQTWNNFKSTRYAVSHDWTQLTTRSQATVFIPSNVPPQEHRDCLHEEIAQALGPLNDLYRLSDSVFNDDNFQITLTPYDMLILRAYYSDRLRNGMSRGQVAERILPILNQLNPQGVSLSQNPTPKTPKSWVKSIETALGRGANNLRRMRAAKEAVRLAEANNLGPLRLGFAHFARARIATITSPSRAEADYRAAYDLFQTIRPEGAIQLAHIGVQLAAAEISRGNIEAAVKLIDAGLPAARETENAALLFNFLALKAQAARLNRQPAEALALRKEANGWGLYAFGSVQSVQNRLAKIARIGSSAS